MIKSLVLSAVALAITAGAAIANDGMRVINRAWVQVEVNTCTTGKGLWTTVHLGQQVYINQEDWCDEVLWVHIPGVKYLEIHPSGRSHSRAVEIHGTAFGTWEKWYVEASGASGGETVTHTISSSPGYKATPLVYPATPENLPFFVEQWY